MHTLFQFGSKLSVHQRSAVHQNCGDMAQKTVKENGLTQNWNGAEQLSLALNPFNRARHSDQCQHIVQ